MDGISGRSSSEPARYRWVPGWGEDPGEGTSPAGMAHHGIAVASDGRVVSFGVDRPIVEIRHPQGRVIDSWAAPVITGHGLRISSADGRDTLWIADNGDPWIRLKDGTVGSAVPQGTQVRGAVVEMSLTGDELRRIPTPEHPAYERGSYCPTDVAVDDVQGRIWVTDGYGQSLVHCIDQDGVLLLTITGAEGAGRFDQPHALHIDRRGQSPELYVTDRGNSRIQVFDLDGRFIRSVGVGTLISPGGIAALGAGLVIAELDGRLVLLDEQDRVVEILGKGTAAGRLRPGWPNALDDSGVAVRPELIPNEFNTPHGIATDPMGNIYVSEWVIGGRLIKLEAL